MKTIRLAFIIASVAFSAFCADMGTQPSAEVQVPRTPKEYVPVGNSPFDNTVQRKLKGEAPKIVPGEQAPEDAYPWMVSLMVSWIDDPAEAHFCGGSIINDRWIRTAAHCINKLQNEPELVHVASGSNYLKTGIKRSMVEMIIAHKEYGKHSRYDNDIALLKLVEPLSLDGRTKTIALAPIGHDLNEGRDLKTAGWGATREGGSGVTDLRHVSVPFVTREECNDPLSYNGAVTENMICAGKSVGGADSCQGDSGGPLMELTGIAGTVQVGIVSWGEGCARPGKFGVYTDVRNYVDWEQLCVKSPDKCQ